MTEEEAISELKDIYLNTLDFKDDRTTGAFEMARQALEKRIPKEPLGSPRIKLCPSCGAYVLTKLFDGNDVKYDFCPKCGQAIDWTDVLIGMDRFTTEALREMLEEVEG